MSAFRSRRVVYGRLVVLIAPAGVVMASTAENGSSDPPTLYMLWLHLFLFLFISAPLIDSNV